MPMIITAKNSEKRRIEGAIQHELFYEKLNCQTSMSFFGKNRLSLKPVNYFRGKGLSYMFERVLQRLWQIFQMAFLSTFR